MRSRAARTEPGRRAGIYTRISKDEAGDELGVQRQLRACEDLAGRLGWTVVDRYQDNNLSAFKKRHRPRFEAMIEAIKSGDIDAIAVYNPDRLSRDDLRGLEDLIDLLNGYEVAVETVRSGEFDLSTVNGRGQARMAGVWARMESERMSERLQDKHAELVSKGKPNGGRRPFGYKNDRVTPEPVEAVIVVEIMGRVAAGETLTRIADDLNERGVPTTSAAPWSISTVRRVALNGRYAGRRIHKGVEVGPAAWPALVGESVWRTAVAVLTDPSRGQRRSSRRYLLTGGLLVCGACGKPLFSKPHHDQHGGFVPTYACRVVAQGGCGGVTIRAENVERLVTEWVFGRVESPGFAKALQNRQGANPKATLSARDLEAQIDTLADERGDGRISEREYWRTRDRLVKRLATAQTAVSADTTRAAVGAYAGQPGQLRGDWETMTLDRRQAIVRSLIGSIVIAPVGKATGNRFDSSRVGEPEWLA